MKEISITGRALTMLGTMPMTERKGLLEKLWRYAETGAGIVTRRRNRPESRLRHGRYRAIFQETASQITLLAVGHRKDIYD